MRDKAAQIIKEVFFYAKQDIQNLIGCEISILCIVKKIEFLFFNYCDNLSKKIAAMKKRHKAQLYVFIFALLLLVTDYVFKLEAVTTKEILILYMKFATYLLGIIFLCGKYQKLLPEKSDFELGWYILQMPVSYTGKIICETLLRKVPGSIYTYAVLCVLPFSDKRVLLAALLAFVIFYTIMKERRVKGLLQEAEAK